jgi:hypothetical protein
LCKEVDSDQARGEGEWWKVSIAHRYFGYQELWGATQFFLATRALLLYS